LDSIMNERDILASISSPFIVNMLHAFTDASHCYLVLDLCLAGDLCYRMCCFHDNVFPEEEMKFFVASIAIALDACHARKILHRDVKPDNVVMDPAGFVRLTDFGISVLTVDLTSTQCSGTPKYMSPESLSPKRLHGTASDFYSLGCCAYQFGAAECPFLPQVPKKMVAFVGSKRATKAGTTVDDKWLPDMDLLKAKYSDGAKEFICDLLDPRPWERIACLDDVKRHSFFEGFDWQGLLDRTATPPCVPDVSNANTDDSNDEALDMFADADNKAQLSAADVEKFRRYDYRTQWGGAGGASEDPKGLAA